MSLPIPMIRERLHSLADQLGVPELHDLAEHTRRRAPARKAAVTYRAPNATLREAIKRFAETHPDVPLQEIGQRFRVNAGRVSEIINPPEENHV